MPTLKQVVNRFDAQSKKAMASELRLMLEDLRAHHEAGTSDWRNKPKFRVTLFRNPQKIIGTLIPTRNGDIFTWVDRGTGQYGPKGRPYFIFPKRAPRLKFQTGYLPRTKPIARFNAGPGRAIGPWVSTDFVLHPGIKAREFTKTYMEKEFQPNLGKRLGQAILRANRR